MDKYLDNINKITLSNTNFRKVLHTGEHMQLVVMSLKPEENIGMEVHKDTDQFFRVEQGTAKLVLNGREFEAKDDFAFIIPAGTEHDIINISKTEDLKLYTIYSPPNHPKGTIHKTKKRCGCTRKSALKTVNYTTF